MARKPRQDPAHQIRQRYEKPLKNPEGIDFVVARENLEGLYPNSLKADIRQLPA